MLLNLSVQILFVCLFVCLLRAAKAYYLHKLSFHERACFNAVYFSICPQRNSDIFSSIEQKIADN